MIGQIKGGINNLSTGTTYSVNNNTNMFNAINTDFPTKSTLSLGGKTYTATNADTLNYPESDFLQNYSTEKNSTNTTSQDIHMSPKEKNTNNNETEKKENVSTNENTFLDKVGEHYDNENIKKSIQNVIFYTLTGSIKDNAVSNNVMFAGLVKSAAVSVTGGNADEVLKGLFEGVTKKFQTDGIVKEGSNIINYYTLPARKFLIDQYAKLSGYSSDYIPNNVFDKIKKPIESGKNLIKNFKDSNFWSGNQEEIKNLETRLLKTKNISKLSKLKNSKLKLSKNRAVRIESRGFKGVTGSSMVSAIGIDYGASIVVNVCKSMYFNDMTLKEATSLENAKYGSQLFKSVWKTSLQIAGKTIGLAVGGPTGEKIGGIIGNVVGAEIGNLCTDVLFDNSEEWCAAAGVATAVGATAGGVITTALVVGGVCATVPGAGWLVGGAIIVGAIAGTLLVAGAKKICDIKTKRGKTVGQCISSWFKKSSKKNSKKT